MKSNLLRSNLLALAALLVSVSSHLNAHHAFAAEFDANKPVKFTGTVVKVDFINPHSWIHMDVKDASGKVTRWMIEGGSPNTLFRRGINKDSLPEGSQITVDGYQAKDGSNKANGRDVTYADGRKIFLSNSNPNEGPGK